MVLFVAMYFLDYLGSMALWHKTIWVLQLPGGNYATLFLSSVNYLGKVHRESATAECARKNLTWMFVQLYIAHPHVSCFLTKSCTSPSNGDDG